MVSADPLFFREKDVRALLRFDALIPAIEQTLIDFSSGKVIQPVRTILSLPEQSGHLAWFGLMPAQCGAFVGAKLVTFYPGNASRSLPTHNASIVLFRADTGQPVAVLDGRLITEMRTAAVSAVATRALSAPSANMLAILGSGVQARSHLEALRLVRDFTQVTVWSRNPDHARLFAEETGSILASTAEEAVGDRGCRILHGHQRRGTHTQALRAETRRLRDRRGWRWPRPPGTGCFGFQWCYRGGGIA